MKLIRFAFAAALCSASVFAADFTGTWVGTVRAATPGGQAPGQGGRGQNAGPLPFIVHLKQTGEVVIGSMDGIGGAPDVEIQNAKIDGNVLTYVGVRKINNQDVKFNYTATLSGDTLEVKIEREGGNPLASTTTRLTPAF